MKTKKAFIINGPNLNMLGSREKSIYGSETLEEIKTYTAQKLKEKDIQVELDWFQSNGEQEIVEKIHKLIKSDEYDFLVINPAAYSHTSIAILDALKQFTRPIIEVHLSNTLKREQFRQNKVTALASTILMEGLGKDAYYLAVLSQAI